MSSGLAGVVVCLVGWGLVRLGLLLVVLVVLVWDAGKGEGPRRAASCSLGVGSGFRGGGTDDDDDGLDGGISLALMTRFTLRPMYF